MRQKNNEMNTYFETVLVQVYWWPIRCYDRWKQQGHPSLLQNSWQH